jgi:H+/Cl- antiporter ClcA
MMHDSNMLLKTARTLLQWLALGIAVGIACGLGSAGFLALLERATHFRNEHDAIVYTLPLAGLIIGALYERWGGPIKGGNNLVLDTFHQDEGARKPLPLRMAPMVVGGTILTHLFGGSAGREGTAVQMGASFADAISYRLGLHHDTRRQLLAAGIAGGFGSVFGTPIAGMLFGLEVVWVGRLEYPAILPALVAALVGDFVTRSCGIVHTAYPQVAGLAMDPLLAGKWLVFGIAVAATSAVFIELTHGIKALLERRVRRLPVRMMIGGAAVVVLWKLVGTDDYLGLGVPTIVRAFTDPTIPWYAFALKLVFTAVTLGAGFLGGEVTPLFFIGATLGATLGHALGIPLELAAGVGLAGVFAAAANTPIALSIMAVELLGARVLSHAMIVCVIAFLITGHRSIYPAQRLWRLKNGRKMLPSVVAVRDAGALVEPESVRNPGLPDDLNSGRD